MKIFPILLGLGLLWGYPPSQPIVLIFADVTGSIPAGEIAGVRQLVLATMKTLPKSTLVSLYPIQSRMELLAPIFETQINEPLRKDQLDRIDQRLQNAYSIENAPNRPEPRTCIMPSLALAASQARQHRQRAGNYVRILVISDMIEECREAQPLGYAVNLSKDEQVQDELNKLMKVGKNPNFDFGASELTFILPNRNSGGPARTNPALLASYWKTFLDRVAMNVRYNWVAGVSPTMVIHLLNGKKTLSK